MLMISALFVAVFVLGIMLITSRLSSTTGSSAETYEWARTNRLDPPGICAGACSVDNAVAPGAVAVVVLVTGCCMRTATARSSAVAPNINRSRRRSMIPSLLHDARTRIKAMRPPLEMSTTCMTSVVVMLPPYPKPFQICFRLAQVEGTLRASPVIHQFRNREKPFRVSTTLPRSEPATDEQVTMNQLVKKRRNEQSSTVLGVLEYGR